MVRPRRDEPPSWGEVAAEHDARVAEGLTPCEGAFCDEWLRPEQVVVSDGDRHYGTCCAVIGAVVDCDLIDSVCQTIFRRGSLLGRRVSVTQEEFAPWALADRRGNIIYAAHDVFEVARRYCFIESGKWELDPDAPTEFHPTDAQIADRDFEDRSNDILRGY